MSDNIFAQMINDELGTDNYTDLESEYNLGSDSIYKFNLSRLPQSAIDELLDMVFINPNINGDPIVVRGNCLYVPSHVMNNELQDILTSYGVAIIDSTSNRIAAMSPKIKVKTLTFKTSEDLRISGPKTVEGILKAWKGSVTDNYANSTILVGKLDEGANERVVFLISPNGGSANHFNEYDRYSFKNVNGEDYKEGNFKLLNVLKANKAGKFESELGRTEGLQNEKHICYVII